MSKNLAHETGLSKSIDDESVKICQKAFAKTDENPNAELIKKIIILQEHNHNASRCNNHIKRINEEMNRELLEIHTLGLAAEQLLHLIKSKTNKLATRTTQELGFIKIFYEDQKKKLEEQKKNINESVLIDILGSEKVNTWKELSEIALNDSNLTLTLQSLVHFEESIEKAKSNLKIAIEKIIKDIS